MKILSRMPSRIPGVLVVFLVCLTLNPRAMSQLPTATILGVVKDASGAIVPDTTLTARNVETGQTRTATSGVDGSFRFAALPVGRYEVRAEHSGFQTEVRSGLTLTVSQEAVVNFSLQVGAVTETVSVSAEAPLVNTTSGSLGGIVNEEKVADLPLNGRNYMDLTLLQPGISQHKNFGLNPTAVGLWYSSNGAPIRSNNYLLDGALMVNEQGVNSSSLAGATLGVDGIREYRVITNSFSAEYGMTMGSQVLLVSKSGTNQWHGDVFEYLRNSALDARNFFDYPTAATPGRLPPYKRNQFGGSFGGPIRKDKTFFYAVYEGLRERKGLSTTIPTVMAAGCHGAAGAVITRAACPQLLTAQSVTIAPVIAPLLALYPLPNLPSVTAGNPPDRFTFPFTQPTQDDYGQIRVDHTFSSNDSLFGRYTIDDSAVTTVIPNQQYPQFPLLLASRNQFATLSENHIFSSALLNTARFSYSRTAPRTSSDTTIPISPQYSFMPGQQIGAISIGGITTLGPQAQHATYFPQNIITGSDDLFYTQGRHSLKFGTLINRFQQFASNIRNTRGTAAFASLANFLQGVPTNYAALTPGSNYIRTYRFSTVGFYAQDDFRVLSNFTLNLGLRYEFMTQLYETRGIQAAFRDIQHDAGPTVGLLFLNPSKRSFSPRLGFAWDVTGNGKTAVRGGFAVLYDLATLGTALDANLPSTPPFSSASTVLSPATLPIPFVFTPANVGNTVSLFDYNMQQPHLLSYNLTVERQLPGRMALTLAYAGSRGINIVRAEDGNPTVPQGIPVNGVCVARPTGQAVNFSQPFCFLGNDPRTNPKIPYTIGTVAASANSFYNALQFGLSKQLSKGLQFQSSYTWSKLIDEGQGDAANDTAASAIQPPFPTIRTLERGPADFDITQNWRFNAIYQLPSPASGVLGKIVNGWQASGILSLQTGYPFTVALNANRSRSGIANAGTGIDRPDLVPGRNNSNITSGTTAGCLGVAAGQQLGTPNLYYDPCAFTVPAAGFLGNAGRNILRGPGLENLDFSLVKNTGIRQLGESGRLEFRAEVFNILNHPNFLIPARTVFAGNPTSLLATTQAPLNNAGVISSTGSATSRQVQLALKLIF